MKKPQILQRTVNIINASQLYLPKGTIPLEYGCEILHKRYKKETMVILSTTESHCLVFTKDTKQVVDIDKYFIDRHCIILGQPLNDWNIIVALKIVFSHRKSYYINASRVLVSREGVSTDIVVPTHPEDHEIADTDKLLELLTTEKEGQNNL